MKKYNMGLVIAVITLLAPLFANAQNLSPIQQKIAASMAMDSRTDGERERDADRDPVNAMEFAGLKDDMTVIEFLP
ncbi:MAG: putative methyltransferase, partial [Pseudohongiellaceae bacterium]